MKMTMFNVGFGESILISDDNENNNLLVDYGSEIHNCTNNIIDYIKVKLNLMKKDNKNIEAMITHFHDDHINGFINLATNNINLFSKIYIPNVLSTYNKNDVNKISFIKIEVILFFLINYKFASGKLSLFEMLKAIADVDAELHMLNRGKIFYISNTKYITLWPNISEIKFMKDFSEDELTKFFIKIAGYLTTPIDLNFKINEISYLLNSTFEKRATSINKEEIKKDIKDLSKKIEELGEFAKELNNKLIDSDQKDELNKWIKKLKKNANKVSIVFQNKFDCMKDNILMTGDIDIYRLNWILNNTLNKKIAIHNSFDIIKAPHHGTKNHFVNNLPITRNILISNGKTNKKNRGEISSCYLKYVEKGAIINCTNTDNSRCEILKVGYSCKGYCNLSNKKEIEISI